MGNFGFLWDFETEIVTLAGFPGTIHFIAPEICHSTRMLRCNRRGYILTQAILIVSHKLSTNP